MGRREGFPFDPIVAKVVSTAVNSPSRRMACPTCTRACVHMYVSLRFLLLVVFGLSVSLALFSRLGE